MGRIQNIFYGIVTSENSMTELLCNFMVYKPFRNSFLKLFIDNDIEHFYFDDFQTQYITDVNNSRPDMAIVNDEWEILVEVKTWDTGLTNNQPNSYLDYLSNNQKPFKSLIFLVPNNYKHISDWNQRVNAWHKSSKINISVKIIYWDQIISIIEHNDLNMLSEKFRDFYELLHSWFTIEPVIFNSLEVNYMFSSEIPKIIIKLYSIIDEVKEYFSQIYTVSKTSNELEYGIYIKRRTDKKHILYLGVWYAFWEEYQFPLCIGVDIDDWPKDIVKKFSIAHKDKYIDTNGYRVIGIDKDMLNDDKCAEKIVDLIKEELERLS
ncbi:MAG: hypothetical protein ACOX6L_11425 [Syntrophomonadaceae bacterium]|jgi:hypothetical protein